MPFDQRVMLRQLDDISWHLNVLRARAQQRSGAARDLMLSEIADVEETIALLKATADMVDPALPGRRRTS
jgi:hypothetical protein